jgi:hypothetical protein
MESLPETNLFELFNESNPLLAGGNKVLNDEIKTSYELM